MSVFDFQDKVIVALIMIIALLAVLCLTAILIYRTVNAMNKRSMVHEYQKMMSNAEEERASTK